MTEKFEVITVLCKCLPEQLTRQKCHLKDIDVPCEHPNKLVLLTPEALRMPSGKQLVVMGERSQWVVIRCRHEPTLIHMVNIVESSKCLACAQKVVLGAMASVRNRIRREWNMVSDLDEAKALVIVMRTESVFTSVFCRGCGAAELYWPKTGSRDAGYEGGKYKVCSRCRSASYCSLECQRSDWKNSHKKVCQAPDDPLQGDASGNLFKPLPDVPICPCLRNPDDRHRAQAHGAKHCSRPFCRNPIGNRVDDAQFWIVDCTLPRGQPSPSPRAVGKHLFCEWYCSIACRRKDAMLLREVRRGRSQGVSQAGSC